MPGNVTASFVKTFDIKRVLVTWAGVSISGWADGVCVQIRPNAQRWMRYVGADGEIARAKSNDTTREVTLTLAMTSLSNDFLSKMLTLDWVTNNGLGPLDISETNGGADLFFAQAWIRTPPDVTYAKEIQTRVWILDTGQVISEIYNADFVNLSQ